MINKNLFLRFINEKFTDEKLYIDKFKPELWFVEIDCFPKELYKLSIAISDEDIRFSTVDKEPSLDFSLYDFICTQNTDAENFINEVFLKQKFIQK